MEVAASKASSGVRCVPLGLAMIPSIQAVKVVKGAGPRAPVSGAGDGRAEMEVAEERRRETRETPDKYIIDVDESELETMRRTKQQVETWIWSGAGDRGWRKFKGNLLDQLT